MKNKTVYVCTHCQAESYKWQGYCSNCGEWNTLEEQRRTKEQEVRNKAAASTARKARPLSQVPQNTAQRIVTGISEFDRVMGGGIVRDSISIVTAKPGAGKSTLLLQVAGELARQKYKVLYASGEESESQIKSRADRLFHQVDDGLLVYSDNNLEHVLYNVEVEDPDLVILDSIQTFVLPGQSDARAGSPTQTMECANAMLQLAKDPQRPRSVMMVGQMTKKDEMAGLRALEHLVDVVLLIEGEDTEELRSLSVTKNRFGSTWERGYFSMEEKGLVSITNPSEFFMTKRDQHDLVGGSGLTVIRDGSRSIIVEIESLVSQSFMPYPTRICECIPRDQLNTLLSVLEQKAGMTFYDKNVVLKSTGGLKMKEQSVNLCVLMSVVSSLKNKGIPSDVCFVADVGLTGELKKVPSLEQRIRELDRMGFKKVFVAKNDVRIKQEFTHVVVDQCKNIQEVIQKCFGKIV
ncbi:DNA repair protein RadA [Alkalibacter rhizosphaerae]|uniref:DNA repair protein RadA n=1 Tax=Alkalibacter rhizosphaerae TaxID=2815577 RepID=A0A974XEA0_9FIRM|nr:DNA repair protein RadA [Alkalibacter rhizosphaerae]QSX08156.1 DNA repair protein RadA [Alkalibacter rhizosphaerae]